jgi:hypothetical protein
VLLPPPHPASDAGGKHGGSGAQGGALPGPPQQQRSRDRPPGGPLKAGSGGTQQVPTQTGSGGPLMGRPRLVEVIVEARSNSGPMGSSITAAAPAGGGGVQGGLQAPTPAQAGAPTVNGVATLTQQGAGEAPAGGAAAASACAQSLAPPGKQQGSGSLGLTGVVVDLSRLNSFKELWEHLATAFAHTAVSGCLATPEVKLVYMDGEGDWLRVTQDDAWPAFVAAARKLLVSCAC